jgi:hypothetical protein
MIKHIYVLTQFIASNTQQLAAGCAFARLTIKNKIKYSSATLCAMGARAASAAFVAPWDRSRLVARVSARCFLRAITLYILFAWAIIDHQGDLAEAFRN